ncbi:MAG: cell division protein ZapB [Deltaproteobacteria bacterium]|nr:cell division protein ZapB [Deltaproteobacteria bacterium]
MTEEISLENQSEKAATEEEKNLFKVLEEKIDHLLTKYQELVKEKERLANEVEAEMEKRIRLEKKMELFSQDREKVKTRIDQLLHRLRNVDI